MKDNFYPDIWGNPIFQALACEVTDRLLMSGTSKKVLVEFEEILLGLGESKDKSKHWKKQETEG